MIEDFVVLHAGACVVGGIRVGRGALLGAHAVVTRDVPPYSVVAGDPSRVLRQRYREEVDSADDLGLRTCRPRLKPGSDAGSGPRSGEGVREASD